MRWSPRQRAMLQEMGLRLWIPEPDTGSSLVSTEPVETSRAARNGLPAQRVLAPRAASTPTTPAPDAEATPKPEGDRPPGISTLDWASLRAAVASCTACGLCRGRTQTVFGTGNTEARWMIVGEAPGEQEDLSGEPFVGKSGQLLDSMLAAVGLSREPGPPDRQVFIANTLKCRPPANRNPEPEELDRCEPFLIRQIELVKPSVIVAMGRFAVQALLRSNDPIGRLRGRVHRYHGAPLVVTYHPAYLLRNPRDKARAWEDLCLALEQVRRSSAA